MADAKPVKSRTRISNSSRTSNSGQPKSGPPKSNGAKSDVAKSDAVKSGTSKSETSKSRTVGRGAHWIEWLTGGICALLVAAMIGWISYDAVTSAGGAPQLSVSILSQRASPAGGGYEVSFTVENRGKRTAASVPVKGEVLNGDTVIETQEITFDYVPAQSSATGTLLFKTDPSANTFTIVASGYTDP